MKSVISSVVLVILCLIFGIRDIVIGYNLHEIFRLVTGCFDMFLAGAFVIITIVWIFFNDIEKKEK